MQYSVAQLLKESVGSGRTYDVDEDVVTAEGVTERARGEVRLLHTDKGIWASVVLTYAKPCICSRCLSLFRLPLELSIEEEYLPTVDVNTGERVRDADMAEDSFLIDGHHILDITEALRQYEVASTPMKPLCREDCAGLCPICGADLNKGPCNCSRETRDARWSVLAKLQVAGEAQSGARGMLRGSAT
jgi:uncharacterized protein